MKRIILLALFALGSISLSAKEVTNDQKKLYIDEQIRFADGLVDRGHYDLAIDEYRRLIKKFPDSPYVAQAWLQLGEAYAAKGDFKMAVDIYKVFFRKFPKSRIFTTAKLRFALVLYRSGTAKNKNDAMKLLSSLASDKSIPDVLQDAAQFHIAKINLESGKKAEAESGFAKLAGKKIVKSPESDFRISAVFELVEIYTKQGKINIALNLLDRLAKNSNISKDFKRKVNLQLGDIYLTKHEYRKAADYFAKIAILFPDDPVAESALYKRLLALYELKEYSKVISEIKSMQSDPNYLNNKHWERLFCLKGAALGAMNFQDKASKEFLAVINKSKNKKMKEYAVNKYVETLLAAGNLSTALSTVNKYIDMPDFSSESTVKLIDMLNGKIGPEELQKLIRRAMNLKKYTPDQSAQLQLKLAAALTSERKYEDALNIYRSIPTEAPDVYIPFAMMGEARVLEFMDRRAAVEKYKELIKVYPHNDLYPEAMLRVGILLLNDKKQWDTSEMYFNALIKRFHKHKAAQLAMFYKGYLAFMKHDYEIAQNIFSELSSEKEVPQGLKNNIQIYLLWSLLESGNSDKLLLAFNSVKNLAEMLHNAPVDFLYKLGEFLTARGNTSSARLCFQEIIKRNNKAATQIAFIGLSNLEMANGNSEKAMEYLRKAIDSATVNATTMQARIKLAYLLSQRGKNDEAILIYEKCLENPVNKKLSAEARLGLAEILSAQEDRLKTALRYAMSVYILSDDKKICSKAMLLAARIALKINDRKSALETWQEFSRRFPDLTDTAEAKKIRKQLGIK